MLNLYELYHNLNETSVILISLAIILLAGFLLTRITKLLKLPNVSAYIVAGILIGPGLLGLVPPNIISSMSFVSDIALAFIAFGVGKFFKIETLRKTGAKVVVITIIQSLLAGVLVTLTMRTVFNLSIEFSVLLGAIATATAPASTMMTIKQYHARGEFVDTLLQVVAMDDVVCLLTFSIAAAILTASTNGATVTFMEILTPILYNLGVIALGVAFGFLAGLILGKRSKDNRLVIIVAMLLAISGVCGALNVSPLLSCMVFGAVYINYAKDKELYHQLDTFTPPIMVMFFVLSGMSLDINSILTAGLMGVAYFAVRIIGKYCGAYLGSLITKKPKEIRNYLGFALVPQAGVAIGLAFLSKRILPEESGNLLMTIILSSSVLYEFIGPVSAKFALFRAGTIKTKLDGTATQIAGEKVITQNDKNEKSPTLNVNNP